ncbi:MAG: sugar ABC transporter substrate-binding protein [Alphaproteobacteria bacterium]|nr:sugar ABC transporter substrate-binding protein [Alphaproteobacteria bacterium]
MKFQTTIALAAAAAFTVSAALAAEYPDPTPLADGAQADVSAVVRDGPLTIAFMPPASTLMFYQPIGAGVRSVAEEAGARVITLAPTDGADTYGQAGMIQDVISQGVDAIIITTHDENAAAPVLKRAVEAGIIVVLVNNDIPSFPTPIHAVVGYSQRAEMAKLGVWLSAQADGEVINIGYLEGLPGYHNTERMEGFISGLDPDVTRVVQTLAGGWTVEGGNTAAMDILQANPEINAIITANDDMAMGVISAERALGRELIITGVDGQTPALEAVAAGDLTATLDVSPFLMGQVATRVVLDIASGKFAGGFVSTPAVIRDGDNILDILRTPEMLAPPPSKTY